MAMSPAGTTENGASFQPSRWDSASFRPIPALKWPGYFHLFLRNSTPAQKSRCSLTAWRNFTRPSTLNSQLPPITLIGPLTGKKGGLTGFENRAQIDSDLKAFLKAKPMTRRFFLRVSSATVLAAPLFQLVGAEVTRRFPSPTIPTGNSWRFFDETEATTIVALCERIVPADADPGAAWAGVVQFIDRQLAGYYHLNQLLYRLGLQGVHQSSLALFQKPFVELSDVQQDELLHKLESNQAPGDLWKQVSAAEFFDRLVDHTIQGFYGGPRHGGNRDAVSWHMLDLPTAPMRSRRPLTAPWATNPNAPSV